VHALNNVSFEVKRGTCLGLLGHNGAQSCHFRVLFCRTLFRCW
jgi:ABC-type polysaccharide/polyol phosphate transport system ATPase subunit